MKRSWLWPSLAVAAGVGVWLWWRSRSAQAPAAGPEIALSVQPVQAVPGQGIVADSYRIIQSRRAGMTYVPASGSPGGLIQIDGVAGMFTGNLVQESDGLKAEIRP